MSSYADGPRPPCPYPGLERFGPGDADRFFGRAAAIARLAEAVARQVFTALIGASGSGKSSVVLAGLAPALDDTGGWRFSHFRIGSELERDPFLALSRALVLLWLSDGNAVERLQAVRPLAAGLRDGSVSLRDVFAECRRTSGGRRILLIADQFEEVFTLVDDEAARERFMDVVLEGACAPGAGETPAISVILTMRADFYGRALRYRPLADALQGHVENLGPMTRPELREAIERPAERVGVRFRPGLVDTLLDHMESRPGSLPLLQFALREMWGRMEGREITHANLESIGGIDGALAQRAQAVFEALAGDGGQPETSEDFRRLFARLVTPGEGQEDTRRVVNRQELGERLWLLAQRLADEDNRLVVTAATEDGRETAEIVHEALIRNWPLLVGWINRDRTFQTWLRQVRPAVELWSADPADDGLLLRGGMLAQASEWLDRRGDDLSAAERAFIAASIAAARQAEAAREEARQRELRRERDLGRAQRRQTEVAILAAGLAFLLAGLAVAYGVLVQESNAQLISSLSESSRLRQEADRAAVAARAEARRAMDNETGALAALAAVEVNAGDRIRAAKLALAAWPRTSGSERVQLRQVLDSLSRVTPELMVRPSGQWRPNEGAAAFAPDGRRLALQSGRALRVRDLASDQSVSAEALWSFFRQAGFAFSPDGGMLAVVSSDGAIRVWTGALGDEPVRLRRPGDWAATAIAFSGDGALLAVAGERGGVALWNTADLTSPVQGFSLGDGIRLISGVALSFDGSRIAAVTSDGQVIVAAPETGRRIAAARAGTGFAIPPRFLRGDAWLLVPEGSGVGVWAMDDPSDDGEGPAALRIRAAICQCDGARCRRRGVRCDCAGHAEWHSRSLGR